MGTRLILLQLARMDKLDWEKRSLAVQMIILGPSSWSAPHSRPLLGRPKNRKVWSDRPNDNRCSPPNRCCVYRMVALINSAYNNRCL
jgi:hypothetical protein